MANQQPPYHNSGYYNPYLYHNGYTQQYAQQPPHFGLNGHPPSHTPPRMAAGPSNGAGRGSFPNRGHQPFHPHHPIYNQHFQHVDGATPSPPPISPTYAHPHTHKSQPTNASYPHYPIHQSNPYLSWPTEPLSPLPKQLSGLNHFPPHATTTPQPGPSTHDVLQISEPVPQPASESVLEPPREPTPGSVSEPVTEPVSEPVSEPAPVSEPIPQPADMPSASPSEESSPIITSLPMTRKPATLSVEKAKNEVAIWSRRPKDPSAAPAIIISPLARPPPCVIDDALDLPTPPLTPIQTAASIPEDPDRDKGPETPDELPTVQTQTLDPSSPVTETTAATPSVHTTTPASPISSRTSISNTSPSEVKSLSTPSTAVPAGIPAAVEPPQDEATEVEVTPPAPPVPATPPVKKSWASLLKNDDATFTGKNALPTSTVVGFSIPGGLVDNSPATPIPLTKKQELATLLTTGPSGPGQVPRIRPRGLINSGNMCFANAVLQVLVYCPPFYRLFTELAKYLPGPSSSDNKKPTDNRISLTTGTIGFLKEFNPLSEKERRRREEDGEDLFLDSFTPVSVYDAMRAQKRFDTMRVSNGHGDPGSALSSAHILGRTPRRRRRVLGILP
jgi:ubiquitin carboxyl-terminal hydrolase 10